MTLKLLGVASVLMVFATGLLPGTPTRADDAKSMARNPIIWADVPDLAVIRVGDTYYMSSTTAHMSPNIPIMKSKDLTNWQLIGYVAPTLGDNEKLQLENGANAYGGGSWASSLRYHDGTFYVTTFSGTTGKTYIYRTKDIEKGDWVETSFSPLYHDHSLFFDDDGRVYLIYGGGKIHLLELTADASAVKPGGVNQVIIQNASAPAGAKIGLPAEGSQMCKVNGKYYLSNITWPPRGMRTQLVSRADKIAGPYEGRIALQDKGVAQGSFIDTPQGDWYALLFQDHGAVGRVPFLVPVTWKDGWPELGDHGKVPEQVNLPPCTTADGGAAGMVSSDEFDQSKLALAWQWNHNPDNAAWSLTAKPGSLRLTTARTDTDLLQARNSLTQRTFGPACSGSTCLDVSNMKDGDFAGLAALQKKYGCIGVRVSGDTKSIVMVSADGATPVDVQTVPLTQNRVYFRLDCDFKNRADKAKFFYSLDGKEWTACGKPVQMTYTIPHFIGYRFSLFNYTTKTPGGSADFDFFHIGEKTAD